MQVFGVILIIISLFGLGIFLYSWLFVHEKGESDPLRIVESQQNQMDTEAGRIENSLKGGKIESQTRLQEIITDNKRAVTDTIVQDTAAINADFNKKAAPQRHGEQRNVEIANNKAYLALKETEQKEHQLRERLIDLAMAQGYDVDTYLKQQLNVLDVQKLEQETMVKLKGGFIYQLQDYQKLTMLRSNLDELYEREHLIESGEEPESVKGKKLKQVRADIETLEQDANGRRQGLLQAYDGENLGGSDSDTEH